MKTIDTLIEDIESVIRGEGGWNKYIADMMAVNMASLAMTRFESVQEPRDYLSLSSIGTPCDRKLWYKVNQSASSEALPANTLLKFFFGDLIEELVLSLAEAAGHTVDGKQTRLEVHGIRGSRDAVIDGITIDVKSASPMSFQKFKKGDLVNDDPFGYISQLSSYVYAGKDDPLVTDKERGGFLVVDKVNGHLHLDLYDFSNQFENKQQEMERAQAVVAGQLPERTFEPVPQSKTSPNMKLPMMCSYCDFKKACWPNLRSFAYSGGPVHLVDVVNEPDVPEIT
jgi:hypothetical protein